MERKLFLAAVVIPWLVIPLTARNYSRAWERLPPRVAVHFDANWRPNGWTSREGARTLALGMQSFLLAVFTIAAFAVSRVRVSSVPQWALVAVFYLVIGLVYFVNQWIVDRSLAQQSAPVTSLRLHDHPQLNNDLEP
jgi:hypothetical protein